MRMLGSRLITHQTPAEGILCEEVMVAKSLFIRREFYFSIVLDRHTNVGSYFALDDDFVLTRDLL